MADDSSLDKILDRLPYSDGTGRRRFVAGGILLIGTIIIFFGELKGFFSNELEVTDFLGSPIILLAAVLILYALGNLTEMIAGLFLVRMASGVMWTVGMPRRISMQVQNRYLRWLAFGGLVFWSPFYMLWEMFRGLRGDTRFRLSLENQLTPEALKWLRELPPKVQSGLYHPVSDDADYSTKYMVDTFEAEYDRRWARRLLGQAEDVSSVTTSFFLIVLLIFINDLVFEKSRHVAEPTKFEDSTQFEELTAQEWNSAAEKLRYLVFAAAEDIGRVSVAQGRTDEVARCAEGIRGKDLEERLEPVTLQAADKLMRSVIACVYSTIGDLINRLSSENETNRSSETPTSADTGPDIIEIGNMLGKYLEEAEDTRYSMHEWSNLRRAQYEQRILIKAMITLAAISIVFLFLYVGYFKTLRIAVVNIVEASVLRGGPLLIEGCSDSIADTTAP